MKNAYNPTLQEIEEWAYTEGAKYPEQDWDIVCFTDTNNDDLTALTLKIASDKNCPNKKSFVHFLYCFSGQVFHEKFKPESVSKLKELLTKSEENKDKDVSDWIQKTKYIIEKPDRYSYKDWFFRHQTKTD